MKAKIEVRCTEGWNEDNTTVKGSYLKEAEISEELAETISEAPADYGRPYKIDDFKAETGCTQLAAGAIKIDDQWYHANYYMGSIYVQGYKKAEDRRHEPIDREEWEKQKGKPTPRGYDVYDPRKHVIDRHDI